MHTALLPSARMRSEGYCSWVCLSVKSHLTYGASVRPENAVTYSAGNESQKKVGFSLKPMRCRDPALPPFTAMRTYSRPFFLRKARMRIIVWASRPALCFPVPACNLPPLASLPLPRLAAQRNGEKRMCSCRGLL